MNEKISYAQMLEASSKLKTSASEMQNILEQTRTLFNQVADEGTWSGTAASQTRETFDTLSSKFHEFHSAITDCSTYLDKVVANYQSVDSAITGAN